MDQYCNDIAHNLSLHYVNNNVTIGPCCQAIHTALVPGIEPTEQPRLLEIKELNKQGQLTSDCQSCISVENAQGRSRRLAQKEFYKNYQGTGLRSLDLHLGNLCNLRCVICSEHNSSSWVADARALGKNITDVIYDKKNQFDIRWLAQHKDLEMVHFWGGEPLMTPAQLIFLEELKKNQVLEQCRLTYNTNVTVLPDDRTLELWKQAHLVELYFSIDDVGTRFEYQRTGANWQNVQNNLQWFYNMPTTNHMFYVTVTWSWLNVYYLPELVDWIKTNLSANRFGDQTQICLNSCVGECEITELPRAVYAALEKKYKNYPELIPILNSIKINEQSNSTTFFSFINKLDQIRQSSYKQAHPEWAEIIGLR